MKIEDIYSDLNKDFVLSYEIFPPKNDFDGVKFDLLFQELDRLVVFNPSLISVTYGAGGTNQNLSIDIIKNIKNKYNVTPMPHFTCVSTSKDSIESYLKEIQLLDIKNILALRGDLPQNGAFCNDFCHASDLIEYIGNNTKLSVAVAGYPEGHIEAMSLDEDLKFLKLKTDLGAKVIFTQLFFNNFCFFDFVERCNNMGINVPIIPGILPIISYTQIEKMISLCRVDLPKKLIDTLEKHKDDKDYIKKYGVEYATEQCLNLIENGVKGLHFYTLNKSDSVVSILSNIRKQV